MLFRSLHPPRNMPGGGGKTNRPGPQDYHMVGKRGVCADGALCANTQGLDQHGGIQVHILPQLNIVVDLGVLHLEVLAKGTESYLP